MKFNTNSLSLTIVLAFAFVFTLASCDGLDEILGIRDDGNADKKQQSVAIKPSVESLAMAVGDGPTTVRATVKGASASRLSWVNSNPDSVTLTAAGGAAILAAKAAGSGVITITHPDVADSKTVVYVVGPGTNSPTGGGEDRSGTNSKGEAVTIKASKRAVTLSVGDRPQTVHVSVKGGEISDLGWENTNRAAIRMAAAGGAAILTPIAAGQGTIKVSHPHVPKPVTIIYTVRAKVGAEEQRKYLTAHKSSFTADIGDTLTLTASLVHGSSLDALSITWGSGDSDIVSLIGVKGSSTTVKALSAGTAKISASHEDSQNILSYTILVAEKSRKYIIPRKNAYFAKVGERISVGVNFHGSSSPIDLLGISWKTNDASIAQLIGSTGQSIEILARAAGATTVVPSHPGAANSPAITIYITERDVEEKDVKYITTAYQSMSLKRNDATTLKARINGGTTLEEQGLRWSVDDDAVVELRGHLGRQIEIKASAVGKATISVVHPDTINTLAIAISVEDSQRTLRLSKGSLKLKTSDPPEPISLDIRNGYEGDYDHVTWDSDDEAVARIFGRHRQVSVRPMGSGSAAITATLGLTGQKATMLVTVVAARYIDLPSRKIRVERGKSTSVDFDYSPSNLKITLIPDDAQGFSATITDEDKLKIDGLKEGSFLLTARAGRNIVDTVPVECYVVRSLEISDRSNMKIEPGAANAATRTFTVVPADEIDRIRFTTASKKNDTVLVFPDFDAGTFSVRGVKEGMETVVIDDPRYKEGRTFQIVVSVEHEDLKDVVDDGHGDSISRAESHHGDVYNDPFAIEKITVRIPPSVSVSKFYWNQRQGVLATAPGGGGHSKIYNSFDNESRTATVYWGNDRGANLGDDVGRFSARISYTIEYGIAGAKKYTRTIIIYSDPF